MLCIFSNTTNPYFNIASEEHLLKNLSDDVFLLYRNSPSVIVGKHQNTLAEIDYRFAKDNGIEVVRRLSGGGTVYHDLGNVNFTFIRNGEEGALVDFKGFTLPIIQMLAELGVEAVFEGHNSLTIKGQKFSGNAEHIYKKRVMHHGTMLFSTNLEYLARVLYVRLDRYSDKAVKSVRANTTNIIEHIINPLTVEGFASYCFDFMIRKFENTRNYEFSKEDLVAIQKLIKTKYTQWDWNFGYSPSYNFTRELHLQNINLKFNVSIEKGMVSSVEFDGDAKAKSLFSKIATTIIGSRHKPDELKDKLLKSGFNNEEVDNLVYSLF